VVWKAVHYGVNPATGRIDYDRLRTQVKAERPKLLIAGGSAYARIIDFAAFRSIADEVDAVFLVDMAHFAGLVAGGVHPSPVPHAPIVTSTTHKTLRGPRAGLILSTAELAKAVAFGEALTDEFKAYSRRVVDNAQTLASALIERGFAIVSGGTDTHLMLVDLRPKNLTGKAAEKVLDQAGITVNKNTIPDDPQSPFVTSGIRLGTPALTTRGMGRGEMERVAELIDRALTRQDEATLARVREEVGELTSSFPLYQPRSAAGRVRRTA
jgi:glycine hydroxymethyltransferase